MIVGYEVYIAWRRIFGMALCLLMHTVSSLGGGVVVAEESFREFGYFLLPFG
jgi:hypothetical protein